MLVLILNNISLLRPRLDVHLDYDYQPRNGLECLLALLSSNDKIDHAGFGLGNIQCICIFYYFQIYMEQATEPSRFLDADSLMVHRQ